MNQYISQSDCIPYQDNEDFQIVAFGFTTADFLSFSIAYLHLIEQYITT